MPKMHNHFSVKVLAMTVLALSALCRELAGQDRLTGLAFTTRSEVIAQHGMAATSQPLATQVALDILKRGGSAVDAAIAANATLGLMEPTGCGIGGDLFAIVWDATAGQLYGLNASGRSPRSLSRQYLIDQGFTEVPYYGPLSVSVPGCVDGWYALHSKFGTLPMSEILAPAIQYAEDGFPVSETIAFSWGFGARRFMGKPGFKETFTINGQAPRKGEIFKNPALAKTLQKLAADGRDAYYKGDIARIIARTVQDQGGFLSYEDLATHTSEWVNPVATSYRGYEVWELPPNGQGIAALQILNILEGYDIAGMGFGSADYIHCFVEAKKLAFEDRAKYYADPVFAEVPVEWLISKEYADERRKLINKNRAARDLPSGAPGHGETIYLTVADKKGNMVSLIQSNYDGLGSGVIPEGLGFMLQNRGTLFTLEEGHNNGYAGGKRPFHTIIPAMITRDGKPWVSFGVMGGDMQPQGHAQIVVNLVDFGMNLQEAGDAPRIRHSGSSQPTGEVMSDGGQVHLESGFAPEVIRDLILRGHDISFNLGGFGGYQAIKYDSDNSVYYGASESRKDGHAAGY